MKIQTNIKHQADMTRNVVKWLVAGVVPLLVIIAAAFNALAWGPDRPTFTTQTPATYVTFDSITDNPSYGDERNFFRIKDAEANNSAYADEVKVEPGKTYEGYIYFHNNASKTFNDAAHNYSGIAKNVSLRVNMPNTVTAGAKARINAYISADNANPKEVWDEAYMTADTAVAIRYVPGSAKIFNGGALNGQGIADSFLTSGAQLGYDTWGTIPGCNEFAGYVTFKFVADKPNFTIQKQVSETGKNDWKDSLTVQPGQTVDYLLSYKNTGTTQQDNVILKDKLPAGMTYVAGSTSVANSANPNGAKGDDGVTTTGINYGSYAPNGNLFVKFSAKVPSADKLKCGKNALVNTVTVTTPNGSKTDEVTVEVTTECEPNECKPGIPNGDPRCEEKCTTPGKEDLAKDDPACQPCTPKAGETIDKDGNCVPAALPTTGPAQVIAGILGVALVALGVAYWIRSRNEYKKALAGFTEDFTDGPKEELLEAKTDHKTDVHPDQFHHHK